MSPNFAKMSKANTTAPIVADYRARWRKKKTIVLTCDEGKLGGAKKFAKMSQKL